MLRGSASTPLKHYPRREMSVITGPNVDVQSTRELPQLKISMSMLTLMRFFVACKCPMDSAR
eukprot:250689-Amphidinium_carterae.1